MSYELPEEFTCIINNLEGRGLIPKNCLQENPYTMYRLVEGWNRTHPNQQIEIINKVKPHNYERKSNIDNTTSY